MPGRPARSGLATASRRERRATVRSNLINTSNVSRLGSPASHTTNSGGGNQEGNATRVRILKSSTASPTGAWSTRLSDCTHGQGALALRPGSEPNCRPAETVLRNRQPWHRPLSGENHCSGARRVRLVAAGCEDRSGRDLGRVALSQENYTVTMAPRIAKGKVDRRRSGRRVPRARILLGVRRQYRPVRMEVLHHPWRPIQTL